jgi:hypothetical protein
MSIWPHSAQKLNNYKDSKTKQWRIVEWLSSIDDYAFDGELSRIKDRLGEMEAAAKSRFEELGFDLADFEAECEVWIHTEYTGYDGATEYTLRLTRPETNDEATFRKEEAKNSKQKRKPPSQRLQIKSA